MHIDNFLYTSPSWPMLRNVAEAQRRPAFFRKSEICKLCLTDGCWIYWMEKRDICNRGKKHIGIIMYTHIMWSNHSGRPVRLQWDRGGYGTVIAQSRLWYAPRNIRVTGLGETGLDFRSQWSLLLVSSEHRTAGSRQPINLAATASIMPSYAHQDLPNTWS